MKTVAQRKMDANMLVQGWWKLVIINLNQIVIRMHIAMPKITKTPQTIKKRKRELKSYVKKEFFNTNEGSIGETTKR